MLIVSRRRPNKSSYRADEQVVFYSIGGDCLKGERRVITNNGGNVWIYREHYLNMVAFRRGHAAALVDG